MATTTMNPSAFAQPATGGRSLEAIRDFFAIAGAAIRCASAVESGNRPNTRDLTTLGISQQLSGGRLLGR